MNPPLPFGVQSYCFRHFTDNAVVAKKVRALGLDFIELCGVHADLANVEAFREIVAVYRDAGVAIRSIGVQTFDGNPEERAWFESAAAAGARHISCHFRVNTFLRAVPQVRAWSREFGIRVGIHCHGGYLFGGQPEVLDYLLALGGPEIGLCLDTAWAMQIGPRLGDPVAWAKKYAGRLYGVHLKDFVFHRNAQWEDTIVGTGNLDLPAFLAALPAGGFDGVAVLEYEGDIENPDPALQRCVDAVRAGLP